MSNQVIFSFLDLLIKKKIKGQMKVRGMGENIGKEKEVKEIKRKEKSL